MNLDDPVDLAIWTALEPMLERRRASMFIRGAVAHALGIAGLLAPVTTPKYPELSSGESVRAKRPTPVQTVQQDEITEDTPGDLDAASNNFLSMFG